MSELPPRYRRPSEMSDDTLPPFSPTNSSLSRRWLLRQDSATSDASEAPSYHPASPSHPVAERESSVSKPKGHVNWSAEPDLIEEHPPTPAEFIPLRVKTGDFEKAGRGGGDVSGGSDCEVENDNAEDSNTLKPTMGWLSGANQCIGLMVGSGIFATPGKVVKYAGSPAMALLVWAFGGMISLFGAIWSMIFLIRPAGEALDSTIFGQYLLYPIYGSVDLVPRWPKAALAVGMLLAVGISGIVVATGVTSVPLAKENWQSFFSTTGDSITPGSLALALFKIFWAFDGWNNLNYSLGELKDPVKTLPRATSFGVSTVVILYMLANTSYLLVLPQAEMIAAEELVAGVFFKRIAGDLAGGIVFPILVAFSGFGAVCAMVYSVSRVIQAGAVAGILPFSFLFKRVHPVTKTPVNALILNWVMACILILAPPPGAAYNFLVDALGYPTWAFYGLSVVGLLMLRKRGTYSRPFKAWTIMAWIFILVSIFLCVFPWVPAVEPYPYWLPPFVGVILT
ncbi:hypothetical protein SmJEL517_g04809 [Synchytrium microbalum]|uniref:Amino acid permease/ SLC12A domain-containing protein n=1 Tax=Synchytrium microbalum TaxID=1806994 RepID=A0A507BYQ0_9FUNG|nr:uncharacterized protein SmJEL517_g04809 [Synchytrium microbalum]TPX31989.1 hypothetical protein SmJEL517_g04809 [Synchytrium microbalum]